MRYAYNLPLCAITFIVLTMFLTSSTSIASDTSKCPEQYKSQKEIDKHYKQLFKEYIIIHPNATLDDFLEYRYNWLIKNNCVGTLQTSNNNIAKHDIPNSGIYMSISKDEHKYFTRFNEAESVPYTLPKGWKNLYMSHNVVIDVKTNNIIKEKDGIKIWTHIYMTEAAISNEHHFKYDGVKGLNKFYCKKKQVMLIHGTYTLGRRIVYERSSNELLLKILSQIL